MKRQYKVSEIISEILNTGDCNLLCDYSNYDSAFWTNVYPTILDDAGDEVTTNFMHDLFNYTAWVGTSTTFGRMLDRAFGVKYGDLVTIHEYDNVTDAMAGLQELSTATILSKLPDLARLYYALSLQYNPLYNKDATETITQEGTIADAHTGDDDREIKGKTQDLTTNASTGARDGQGLDNAIVTEDASKVPYNNVNHYDTDRVETETPVMGSDSTSINNVDYHDTVQYNSDLTKTFDKTDTHRSYGNLGVTKSTDLLESEYQLRMQRGFWDYVYHLCLDKQLMRGVVLCE